ncbi:MAG: NAD(P)H-binding protein [Bacteroidetes bacterium]|jgi:uncharacterized protein YbjT (DUF2867 family)|nr:NAD(P)H-binding protein [Bacteroidota bacterium]
MSIKVAFIGASGMLGKPVATQLIKHGIEVTALARNAEQLKKDIPGISTVSGNMNSSSDLDTLLKGKEVVYLSLSIKQNEKKNAWHTESEGMEMLIASAKRNGIKRIAYLSSIIMDHQGKDGFNWWVFDLKHKAVKMIKDSGIPYTIFYPSNFMESLSNMYKMGNKMMLAGESKEPMFFISGADYGKQVARAIIEHNNGNREYYVQGPQAFTADRAVEEFMKHYTKEKLSISRAPLGVIKFFGMFSTKMNYGANILEALNNYPEKFMAQKTWDELGKPETTIADYARQLN